jgi:hypothetical protein
MPEFQFSYSTTGSLFSFGEALEELRDGCRLTRKGWNGRNQWIELQLPDQHSKMTLPYIFITTVQGDRVPWLASQSDLLADDWCRFDEDAE